MRDDPERLFTVLPAKPGEKAALITPIQSGVIDAAVADLVGLQRRTTISFATDIARIVIDRFFNGNTQEIRRRGPKDVSLRRLAEHPALPISKHMLYTAVRVYELLDRMGWLAEVRSTVHLSFTHLEVLLPAPEDEQPRLAQAASEQHWSVTELKSQVAAVARSRRGGRRPKSAAERLAQSIAVQASRLAAMTGDLGTCSHTMATSILGLLNEAERAISQAKLALSAPTLGDSNSLRWHGQALAEPCSSSTKPVHSLEHRSTHTMHAASGVEENE